jgi:single-strand DNA-binding protein
LEKQSWVEDVMNHLNSILIEGNLVNAPDLRSMHTNVCTFTLESNRFFKQDSGIENEISYFDVEAWGKLAKGCYSQGRKGRGVRVVGRLKQERWSDADGTPHTKIIIIAEHVEFRPVFTNKAKEEQPDDGRESIPEGDTLPRGGELMF